MADKCLVVGVTGASGAIYAVRFLRAAVQRYQTVYLILSDQAIQVANHELNLALDRVGFNALSYLGMPAPNLTLLDPKDYFTPPASGSFVHDGMVIVPCSMGTIGRIAHGVSDDLLTRCVDVCLKEGRKLILVPRETPMNQIMLSNLARLAGAGARILPACPAWYHRPQTVEELADTVVARILQNLDVEQDLTAAWMSGEQS